MGAIVGVVLALAAVLLVLEPVLRASTGRAVAVPTPLFSDSDDEDDPALARRDRALAALKEIDFDRATGKLSDADYERMKAQFTLEALEALRAADTAAEVAALPPAAPRADSRVPDHIEALIASARGPAAAKSRFCVECGAPLAGREKFCLECGSSVGAGTP
jgi:hypothetical protein